MGAEGIRELLRNLDLAREIGRKVQVAAALR